MILDEVAVSD